MASGNGKGKVALSEASPYEMRFGTRHRRVGRPAGEGEPLFAAPDVHPLLASTAKRRATAVVFAEQRDRLAEVFSAELKVLRRRGVERVAADLGVELAEAEGANHA